MSDSRASAYGLLSHLLRQEVDRPLLDVLRSDPALAASLPAGTLEEILVQLSAEYTHLFGISIFPYESVFVDGEVLLHTDSTATVQSFYQSCGFAPAPSWRLASPDHIAVELAFLQALSAAELDQSAVQASLPSRVLTIRQVEERFLREHVAAWLPSLTLSVRRCSRSQLYPMILDVAVELVLAHLTELLQGAEHPVAPLAPPPDEAGRLPSLTDASPEEVADFFTVPAYCGLFISRSDLMRIATSINVPLGFSGRRHSVRQLFEEAVSFEVLPSLLERLEVLLRDEQRTYTAWCAEYPAAEAVLTRASGRLCYSLSVVRSVQALAGTAAT
ncbi:MAG: molecular chaperone TorD family protein [Chloroflexi bacterium]|nr:molecular chaperone TorD family protein [Chloroflexota bacterium]